MGQGTGNPAASYQIATPEHFSFTHPEEWPKWIRRFERFRQASGLVDKSEESQVNTLIYTMGDEADDILSSFHLTEEEMGKYSAVKKAFENHFIKKRTPIFERAKFNQRTQEEGESVDSFVTSLHTLVKHCDYGALQDRMIRDRLVVGIRDAVLSEKLQMEPDLDLEKAVSYARQRETVRKQQSVVRGSSQVKVEAVQTNEQGQAKAQAKKSYTKPFTKPSNLTHGSSKSCTRCGRTPYHSHQSCPARDATCHRCKNKGHFQSQCRTKNVRTVLSEPQDQLDDEFYIATVHGIKSTNVWTATIRVNGVPMEFKIDTGADVSVLPESALQHLKGIRLQPSSKRLTGPNAQALVVRGQFLATCTYKDQHVREEFFVVQNVHTALVGRPAIEALGLVTRIGSIRKSNIQEKYPGIFQGLGTMQGEYHIQLRSGAVPFSQTTPRRVALPMYVAQSQRGAREDGTARSHFSRG